jgi:digeranylgeranylglycerophospholipid reductase
MSEHYDALVVGAGPAGEQCARDLAARNYDVCVLETESEDEFPAQSNKSTAGTFPSTMASFGIPDDVVMNFTDTVVIESPNDHYTQERAGAVLEFADFKQWMAEDAQADGATFEWDARVSRPIMDGGEVVGVQYNGDEELYADIVIDASGPAAVIAQNLDVCDLQREKQAIGIEYEYRGVDPNPPGFADLTDAMMLRLDHDRAPGGYAWLFHTGADTAKVGVCYIQNNTHQKYARDGFTIDDYLHNWVDEDPRFEDAERIEGIQHRGSAHIQAPTSMSTDNFMAIGDTVPTIDPLWGEGIDKCMRSGRAAAITVDAALTPAEPDTSAETMALYDDLWHERVAPKAKKRLVMTELLYLADNDRYDKLVADLSAMDQDALAQANKGNVRALLRLFDTSDLPLLTEYAKTRLPAPLS